MSPHPISDEQLVAFARYELDRDATAAISAHLATCARCKRFVAAFRLVADTLQQDDSRLPPTPTLERAYAIPLRARAPGSFPLFTLRPMQIFVALVLGVLALLGGAVIGIAAQDIPPENALYPIKSAVEVFQTTVSDTWRSLGGSRAPSSVAPSPTRVSTTPLPPSQINPVPSQSRTPPGQMNVPPGQTRTPPGQINTPPGQDKTPPGQVKTPPGQVRTPTKVNVPPGQVKTPPGQEKTPPGQANTPSSQSVPPGQNNPPGQSNPPGSKNESPGQGNDPPKNDKEPPGQQKNK